MIDLTTTYMGMKLQHPIVPSASPLSENIDGIRRLEDAGAAAIVLYSLFEEQINRESHHLDDYLTSGTEGYAEAIDYFPDLAHYHIGPDSYLALIRRAKESVNIPIIGSLNGVSTGGWIEYARHIQQAGADGLELNLYYIPTDPYMSSLDVEEMYLNVVRDVRAAVTIPLALKLSPFFTSMTNMAHRFAAAGANALVLFNRFYQPDFEMETLEVVPNLTLSTSQELRLPLRWVAMLYGRIPVDFAITTGIHTHYDVLKGVMAGANITMMASELLKHGVKRIPEILFALKEWMEAHDYEAIEQLQGSMSQKNVAEPAAFERANYMKVIGAWKQEPTGFNPVTKQYGMPVIPRWRPQD